MHLAENGGDDDDGDGDVGSYDGAPVTVRAHSAAAASTASRALVSSRGTVRGVRNKVRSSIAAFLEHDDQKTYRRTEEGKVCVYTTSLKAVRETYDRCLVVKKILQTHCVRYEERDVSERREHYGQLCRRLGRQSVAVPQLFAGGDHIGDDARVVQLNETGELRSLLQPFQKLDGVQPICTHCGGLRFVPCSTCGGSKKSPLANAFKPSLKCMLCDKRGLTRCDACREQQE